MAEFLASIPAAAASPYALVAYAIAAVLFLFGGSRLRMAKILAERIEAVPESDRKRTLEMATGTVLPTHISPEQWLRLKRMQWTFLLLAAVLIAVLSVSVIAIGNPSGPALSPAQYKLLETLAEYQRKYAATKLVIGREDGDIFPEPTPPNLAKVSLVSNLYGKVDGPNAARFEQLLESMPQQYLRVMNEARYDNPFVLQVTEAGFRHVQSKR